MSWGAAWADANHGLATCCVLVYAPTRDLSHTACRLAANPHGASAVSQSVVDVKHRLSLQDGAFLLYVESAVPLFALALKVFCMMTSPCHLRQAIMMHVVAPAMWTSSNTHARR